MVSECNPITNVVKTTILTMATTLNCSSDRLGAGSGKHISIRVRAQLLQPPKFSYFFQAHKLFKFTAILFTYLPFFDYLLFGHEGKQFS